jgi:uncharacterized membrane protein
MSGFERSIGRLLIVVTYVAAVLLLIGVLLMLVGGISPLSGGPPLDVSTLAADLASLQPAGFLWLGLVAVIATPITRVVAAAIAFGRAGESRMVMVAIAILAVIAVSITTALVTG